MKGLNNKNMSLDMSKEKALIIASLANDIIVSRLISGAEAAFDAANIAKERQTIIRVPGAMEIPVALKKSAPYFDIFVVLGVVIKGQTDHYEHVSRIAMDGVLQVCLEHTLPLGNGIMTVHTMEQALARADGPSGNLGIDAARAALSLRQLFLNQDLSKMQL